MKKNYLFVLIGLLLFPALSYGAIAILQTEINLSETVKFDGVGTMDLAGESLAFGDINGDGYDDAIIGSYSDTVYLVYNENGDISAINLNNADAKFTSEVSGDYAGVSVASDDINNDGYDDIIIGAYNNAGKGAVYIIYGKADNFSDMSLTEADVKYSGENSSDMLGVRVFAVDANNDGFVDVAVNATMAESQKGAVYLIYGQQDNLIGGNINTADVKFTGETSGDAPGAAVAVGNLNNDSYQDLIISATCSGNLGNGYIYIFYGSDVGFASVALNVADAILTGEASTDAAGFALAIGDINNDSYDDIITGAPNNDAGGSGAGMVYIIYGDSNNLVSGSLTTADVTFEGEGADFNSGTSLKTFDFNHDNYKDIAIGAPAPSLYPGYAYVYNGSASGISGGSLVEAPYKFIGENNADWAGNTMATSDVNNDGFSEIMIGAPLIDTNGDGSGAAYLAYLYKDSDKDGIPGSSGLLDGTDCNDNDATVSSEQTFYIDSDLDGYGSTTTGQACASTPPSGYSSNNTDCDDTDALIFQTINYYIDSDLDGYGTGSAQAICAGATPPSGYSTNNTDCDDTDNTVYTEQTYYIDSDLDGYGSTTTGQACASTPPSGYSSNNTDCDDTDNTVNANQTYYQDLDGDTLGDPTHSITLCSSTPPTGYASNDDDLDDTQVDNQDEPPPDDIAEDDPIDEDEVEQNLKLVSGYKNGQIQVQYTNDAIYYFTIFSGLTTDKLTIVLQYPKTAYYLVLHPQAKKIALVNAFNGTIQTSKTISKKAYSTNALKLFTIRKKSIATIISKKKSKNRLTIFRLNIAKIKLAKKSSTTLTNKKISPNKTSQKKNSILLKSKKGKILAKYLVTKKLKLKRK